MSTADAEDAELTGINVTPLVDIVLVLLIIFLVTANFVVRETIEVEVPAAAKGPSAPTTPPLMISLGPGGALFLDGVAVDDGSLRLALARAVAQDREVRAVVAADPSIEYARVVRLVDLVKAAGVARFALNLSRSP